MGTSTKTFYTAECDDCGKLGTDEDDEFGWDVSAADAIEHAVGDMGWRKSGDRLLCADCADICYWESEEPVVTVVPAVPEPLIDDWCKARGLPTRTFVATGAAGSEP